jgi:hypothetical protein
MRLARARFLTFDRFPQRGYPCRLHVFVSLCRYGQILADMVVGRSWFAPSSACMVKPCALMIISASYKTYIPAFYGDWFINRLRLGHCRMRNPWGSQLYDVPLDPESVDGFVFWT